MSKLDRHQIQSYPLRMPDDLRTLLKEAARANERSLGGEIVHRLRTSFTQPKKGPKQ